MTIPSPPRRRWKRFILKSLLFAAIGLLATLSMSWAASVVGTQRIPGGGMFRDNQADIYFVLSRTIGYEQIYTMGRPSTEHMYREGPEIVDGRVPSWLDERPWREYDASGRSDKFLVEAFGWPWRWVLRGECSSRNGMPFTKLAGVSLFRSGGSMPPLRIPTYVLPWRFAAAVALWSAVSYLLYITPGILRRASRKRKDQCVACGYSLKDLPTPTCPECGTTTPRA